VLGILEAKHHAEAVVVIRFGAHAEAVITPSRIARNQHGAVPATDEIAAPAPDVAALVQPAVGFDTPDRWAFDSLRVINHRPAIQVVAVKSFIKQGAFAGVYKQDRRRCKQTYSTTCDRRRRRSPPV